MGTTVDMFVKLYKSNSKSKDKTFEDFLKKHLIRTYVSFLEKVVHCDAIIKASCHMVSENRDIIKVDSPLRYVFFAMKLIELYTDIEINKDNVIADYDKLREAGALDALISLIPENEYTEFKMFNDMKLNDFYDNEYSTTSILYNMNQVSSLSDEIINSTIEEINNNE